MHPGEPVDPTLRLIDWLKLATLVAVGAYLLGGPAWRQVASYETPLIPQWVMFTGFGLDVCTVDYRLVQPDGVATPIDRYGALGVTAWRDGPRNLWRVPDADTAQRIGQRICRAVAQPAPDVRVVANCARRSGWKTELDGTINVCVGVARAPQEARP